MQGQNAKSQERLRNTSRSEQAGGMSDLKVKHAVESSWLFICKVHKQLAQAHLSGVLNTGSPNLCPHHFAAASDREEEKRFKTDVQNAPRNHVQHFAANPSKRYIAQVQDRAQSKGPQELLSMFPANLDTLEEL